MTGYWQFAKLHGMANGRQLLKAWIGRSNQNQRALAATLGVSDGYLSQLLSGIRMPGRELSVAIESHTGVPVGSWSDTRRGKVDLRPNLSGK